MEIYSVSKGFTNALNGIIGYISEK
jgi:hypothetical protein